MTLAVEATTLEPRERVESLTRKPGSNATRPERAALLRVAVIGAVPLLGLLICLAATKTDALVPANRPPVFTGPFEYLGFRLPTAAAIALIALLLLAYVVAAWVAERVAARTVWIAVITFNVIVLIGTPLFSTDVFSYQEYARLMVVYHANPYTHGATSMLGDRIYPYIGAKWINTPSVYGPLFTLMSGAIASASVSLSAFIFKLVAALASGATLWLLWRCAKLRGVNPTRAVAIFGLNPLVTLYGVGGGHNDLLMLVFTTLGIYAILQERDLKAGGAIIVGAGIKLTGVILLPFALAAGRGRFGTRERRLRLLVGATLATVVIAVPSFIVFGSGLFHMLTTLRNVQDSGQWQSIPGFFLNWLANGETRTVSTCIEALMLVIVLALIWAVYTERMDWLEGAGWAVFAMLATAGSLLPWYVSWMFPMVGLTRSRNLWRASMAMTVIAATTMVGTYLPGGHL